MKKLAIVICLAFLMGCAATQSSVQQNFSAQTPNKWYQVNTPKFYILTKDGPYSQYILVQQRPIEKPFAHTQKILARGMASRDAAAVFVDEIRNDEAVLNFRLLENKPATVNGYEAFKLVFAYEDKDGLKFQTYMYGFLNGNWFYTLRYNADLACYCSEDIEEFQKFAQSFKAREA
jgi:hypothetical protein